MQRAPIAFLASATVVVVIIIGGAGGGTAGTPMPTPHPRVEVYSLRPAPPSPSPSVPTPAAATAATAADPGAFPPELFPTGAEITRPPAFIGGGWRITLVSAQDVDRTLDFYLDAADRLKLVVGLTPGPGGSYIVDLDQGQSGQIVLARSSTGGTTIEIDWRAAPPAQ